MYRAQIPQPAALSSQVFFLGSTGDPVAHHLKTALLRHLALTPELPFRALLAAIRREEEVRTGAHGEGELGGPGVSRPRAGLNANSPTEGISKSPTSPSSLSCDSAYMLKGVMTVRSRTQAAASQGCPPGNADFGLERSK